MKHSVSITSYSHSAGDIAKIQALLKALPKNFLLRSSAARGVEVNPAVEAKELRSLVKGWTEVLTFESTSYYQSKKAAMSVSIGNGHVNLQVFSSDVNAEAMAEKAIQPYSKYKFENKDENGVWVNFCFGRSHGVDRNTQFLRCPNWSEIQGNYPSACYADIDRAIKSKSPWKDGRLMIWHGEAGTGKTFAIRSLFMAWREKFNFVIVTDPEKMLESPSYYYEVASSPNRNAVPGSPDEDEEDESTSQKKRLLFILEDCGDLISTESRKRHWDKFGKLLNITDGLVGQGREDVFLISFNEALEAIDKAMVRPGRCLSRVEFGKFTPEEAVKWMAKNGVTPTEFPVESASLAELYQMKAKAKKQSPVTV